MACQESQQNEILIPWQLYWLVAGWEKNTMTIDKQQI